MKRTALLLIVGLAIAAAAAAGGYWFAMARLGGSQPDAASAPAPVAATSAADTGRKPLYYYDPMFPQQKFDKPGKSPFMDMQLVAKYADEGGDEGTVSISPRVVQNLGIRTAEARPGSLAAKLTAVGNVEYNERSVVVVQPRANGFVEKLHVRAPLDPVRAGDALVEILFPEWAAAQEEFLLLRRLSGPDGEALRSAARQRLVLLGMSEEQIAAVEREGKVQVRVTLRAPVSGVIAELGVREGMTVSAGATLFRIAGLGTVWVVAEMPEAQAGMLVAGARVEARVPAYPEETFAGRMSAILPEVNAAARTVRARVEVANPAGKLKPGMYATLALSARGREGLVIPSEAVIRTGERSVVILAQPDGRFRAADVEIGVESGGDAEVRKGLKPGDKVVVSGQFLIDSEASLRTTLARLEGAAEPATDAPAAGTHPGAGRLEGAGEPATEAPPAGAHRGEGRIDRIANGEIVISHGPISSAGWGSMTMGFRAPPSAVPQGLKQGDRIRFEFRNEAENGFPLTRVERLEGAKAARR